MQFGILQHTKEPLLQSLLSNVTAPLVVHPGGLPVQVPPKEAQDGGGSGMVKLQRMAVGISCQF